MTAIGITYEDGLRLSELTGQLRGLEYEASHMLATHIADLALAAILGIALAGLAWVFLSMISDWCSLRDDNGSGQKAMMLSKVLFIVFPVIGAILAWVCVNATVDMQIVEVQGQMDAILSRYEAGA